MNASFEVPIKRIPIAVTARNEAKNIMAFLQSVRASVKRASNELGLEFEIHVILNDNEDNTADLLSKQKDVQIWQTSGGLVEAQRAFVESKMASELPFIIFSDADIWVQEATVLEISRAMLENPELQVAYAEKYPIHPLRNTLLAWSLYLYNLNNGYQTKRNYFNGQFFAIRKWDIPKRNELKWDPILDSNFYHLAAGIRCDDIYLSRRILSLYGPQALHCVSSGVLYRPPETLKGMFRKYQRMRLEIERIDRYFPGSQVTHQQWGRRRIDLSLLKRSPLKEKLYYFYFCVALTGCKAIYWGEQVYYTYFSKLPCPTWQPVSETKEQVLNT